MLLPVNGVSAERGGTKGGGGKAGVEEGGGGELDGCVSNMTRQLTSNKSFSLLWRRGFRIFYIIFNALLTE